MRGKSHDPPQTAKMLSENTSNMHLRQIIKELSPGKPAVRKKNTSSEEINVISGGLSEI